MDVQMIAILVAGGTALGVVVWMLANVGQALIKIAERLAAAAVVFFALWLVIKAVAWALRQTVTYWRTSLTVVGVLAWCHWWGWDSLATTAALLAAMLILICASPARAALTGSEQLAAVYEAILSAQFDRADAGIGTACPPAPAEACRVLQTVSVKPPSVCGTAVHTCGKPQQKAPFRPGQDR